MARDLLDESLPRSLARRLAAHDLVVFDVRDVGLRGRPDDEIFRFAVREGYVLVSRDSGFGNVLGFPSAHTRAS
jgi:predicted nuclease of predicted toxin-antitoxin system